MLKLVLFDQFREVKPVDPDPPTATKLDVFQQAAVHQIVDAALRNSSFLRGLGDREQSLRGRRLSDASLSGHTHRIALSREMHI